MTTEAELATATAKLEAAQAEVNRLVQAQQLPPQPMPPTDPALKAARERMAAAEEEVQRIRRELGRD
jgi:hypothetical protein